MILRGKSRSRRAGPDPQIVKKTTHQIASAFNQTFIHFFAARPIMLYLDVTDACKSSRNTGIERMTRKIFAELEARREVTPLCWNEIGQRYHLLGAREQQNLRTPFLRPVPAMARPERDGASPIAEMRRLFSRTAVDLPKRLRAGDVFLITDIFRDRRLRLLPALARSTRAHAVAVFHDAAALSLPFLSRRGEARFRDYLRAIGEFQRVICVSHESETELQQRWRELGSSGSDTSVEEWPIDFDESLRADSSTARTRIVLSVGSLEPRKNHLTLLQAAERLWDSGLRFELQLIGQSNSWGMRNVVPKIKRLHNCGLPIRWLRHVNDETLHRAYRECRFTVYPSLREGFGLPILESLWHRKPCICGRNGALGEAGAAGGCLLVDQQNVSFLAAGIEQLLEDDSFCGRLSAEARQRRFRSWQDYIARLEAQLESCSD